MDTNKIVIGDVYQIKKWDIGIFNTEWTCTKIKEDALLFKKSSDIYMDIETKLNYYIDINENRQLGDAVVFSKKVKLFNQLAEEEDKCNDIPVHKVKKIYKKMKKNIRSKSDNKG